MAMWVESRVGNKFHLAVALCLCSAKRRFPLLFVVLGRFQKAPNKKQQQQPSSEGIRLTNVCIHMYPPNLPLLPPAHLLLPLLRSTDHTELHASLPAALSLGLSAAEERLAGWERAFEPLSHVHLPGDQLHGRNCIPEPASEYWESGYTGGEWLVGPLDPLLSSQPLVNDKRQC